MTRHAHPPVPLRIPDAGAPGRLDTAVLQAWARSLAGRAAEESLRRAAIPVEAARGSAAVLPDGGHWQYPADALWFAAGGPGDWLHICISPALARAIVALCLGYESPSAHQLTGSDRRLLAHWLQPLVDGFAELVARPGQAYVTALNGAEPAMGAFAEQALVLFSLSLSAADEHGTVQLAAPWDALRPAATRQVAASHGHQRVAPEALTAVDLPVDARIAGGTISVTETLDLAPGDVLVLDSALQGTVELRLGGQARLGGQTVAIGRLGSQGGKWAVRIAELRTESILGRNHAGRNTGDSQ